MQKLIKRGGGFTLLELLIVVVIVAIVAVLVIPSFTSAPANARDKQRKQDLLSIKSALETYYNDNNYYPSSQASAGAPTCVANASNCLGSVLTTGGTPYIKAVPADPKHTGSYVYTYAPTPSGCVSGGCTSYTLTAMLENTKDSQAVNGVYTVDSAN
jgi:general secretion pathway protein G